MVATTTAITTAGAEEFAARAFDFIVVGGGTAGLAVAARLAENPAVTVGVLEAGSAGAGDGDIDIPGRFGSTLGGRYDWRFETVAQPGLGGRVLPWPRGKVLGGTSALNFMTWNRGSRQDYDAWEELGNPGWGWESLLPFFKKSETFHPPAAELQGQHQLSFDPSVLGDSGPIHVAYGKQFSASHALWHQTLNALGAETNSAHLAGSNVGVWTSVCSVNPDTAVRSYAVGYCSPGSAAARTNLHILTEAQVQEVVLAQQNGEWTATGVRFNHSDREFFVSASREVVLCAGAVQSPQILELSGIGRPDVLSAAGIPLKVKSPTVGENLQDHIMLAMVFEVDPSLANPDDLKHDELAAASARTQYSQDGSGPLSILPESLCYLPFSRFIPENALESISSTVRNLATAPPEHQSALRQRFGGEIKLGQMEYIFDLGNWNPHFQPSPTVGRKYGTMLQILQYPFSRGSIHIRPHESPEDPPTASAKPIIDPGYYAGPHGALDLETMIHGARFASQICRTAPLSNIIRRRAYPPAPPAATGADANDDPLHDWVVESTTTDWHPVGTCAMGGRGGVGAGVVDERLRVYGVTGLRVADASIMPLQISAHLQATVYAIAEKAAHMIAEDTGCLR